MKTKIWLLASLSILLPIKELMLTVGFLVGADLVLGAIGALIAMTAVGLFLFLPEHLSERWAQLTVIYGVIILGGLARSFLTTARQAIIAEILPRDLIPSGVRWRNTLFELACVIGPGLAGLMVWLGEKNGLSHPENVPYTAMTICFAGSLGLTIALRTTQTLQTRTPEPIFVSLRQGIDFMLSQRIMLGAFTMDLFAVLLGGAVALLPIFADMLEVGAFGFGMLRAAGSVGAVLMSLYLIIRPPLNHAGRSLYGSFAVFGLSTILPLATLASMTSPSESSSAVRMMAGIVTWPLCFNFTIAMTVNSPTSKRQTRRGGKYDFPTLP